MSRHMHESFITQVTSDQLTLQIDRLMNKLKQPHQSTMLPPLLKMIPVANKVKLNKKVFEQLKEDQYFVYDKD